MTDVKQPEERRPVVENAILTTPIVIESNCIRMVGKDGSVHISCSLDHSPPQPEGSVQQAVERLRSDNRWNDATDSCPHCGVRESDLRTVLAALADAQRENERRFGIGGELAIARRERDEAQARLAEMTRALTNIAAFDDAGAEERLFGAFDEPGSVQIARDALSAPSDLSALREFGERCVWSFAQQRMLGSLESEHREAVARVMGEKP